MKITERLLQIAEKYPKKGALVFLNKTMSFAELANQIQSTALKLKKQGVCAGDTVIINCCRGVEYVIYALSLLINNCVVVPVMRDTPKYRFENIVHTCRPQYIISISENAEESDSQIVRIDDHLSVYPRNTEKHDNAYILFTSGSTGVPKGVLISRLGWWTYVNEAYKNLEYIDTNIHLSCCAYSFDVHFTEIFVPILNGSTVVIASDRQSKNPRLLAKLIDSASVDTIWMTPSKMRWLWGANVPVLFCAIRNIFLAGEMLDAKLTQDLMDNTNATIWNAYGPTEATNYVTIKKIDMPNNISIGKAVPWVCMLVLSDEGEEVKDNEVGEFCILSAVLSPGYCYSEEETSKHFFYSEKMKSMVYKTGDYGFRDVCGEYHIIGRKDRQVKINGNRIELDEIESILQACKKINQSSVLFDRESNQIIIMYIGDMNEAEILEYLSHYIAINNLPHRIIRTNSFCFNVNGKVDRNQTYAYMQNREEKHTQTLCG